MLRARIPAARYPAQAQGLRVKYAKLAPPRVFDALARPRLFERLEQMRQVHPVIWITAPPGSGKTSLAASYLCAAGVGSVWYQIDKGDADPATLFFFLGETIRKAKPALPWLAPELSGDVPRFALRFFREYYARLPQGTVVVFDNIHDFDWANGAHLMEIALAEVPEGITVLALSREAAPAAMARLELSGRIAHMGWDDLRLDDAEMRALARLDQRPQDEQRRWLQRLDGWAAGAVMLREHVERHHQDSALPELEGRDTLFRYFAGEILGRMPPASQHLLVLLSCLPGVTTVDAQRLTGDRSVARLLSSLYHSRLFIDRRGPAPHTYHFHALFQEFLQHEAEHRLDPADRARMLERAGAILDAQGRTDEAVALYRDAAAFLPLAALLLGRAKDMLASGRGQSWREWAGWLPAQVHESQPWLAYWQGSSLNHIEPVAARKELARAAAAFEERGELRGRLLAVAAIVDSYIYEWADFSALPGWLAALQQGLTQLDGAAIDAETQLKIHSRLTLGLFLTDPDSPAIRHSAHLAFEVISQVDDPAEQLAAGTFLLDYFIMMDSGIARQLFAAIRHLADCPSIGPFYRIWWCRPASYQCLVEGNHAAAAQMVLQGERLATEFGLAHLRCHFRARMLMQRLAAWDLASAGALLEEMRQTVLPSRKHDVVYLRMLETSYQALRGDTMRALQTADEALRLSQEAAAGPRIRNQIYSGLACCHLLAGDLPGAGRWAEQAIEYAHGQDKANSHCLRRFVQAHASLQSGDEAGAIATTRVLLKELHQDAGRLGMVFSCFPQLCRQLFVLALREGIEVDYVRSLVLRQQLPPPDRCIRDWPWPVAVRSLGRFELVLAGEAFRPAGKVQQRPLMLLKALLIAGESGKAGHALAAQLWPDSDDSKAALNTTLHRLRKLLGHDGAILVSGGKVKLSDARVWTDVAAFTELCAQIECAPETAPASSLAADLLALYQGPFLDGQEESWLLAARDRWRNQFLRAVGKLGQSLEESNSWAAANQLYARALEAEPLAESLYRSLMRCAHAQGDPGAATSFYRRCGAVLSALTGRKPSSETEKLAAILGLT